MTQKMGLLVRVDKVASVQPSGTVLSQWPEAGEKVKRGKILILKVSKGGNRRAFPDVRGLEYGQSVARLEQDGFSVGDVLKIHDENNPAGVVVAQNPAAPGVMPEGRHVDLLVSLGPESIDGLISVPDAVGRPRDVAAKLVRESGLTVGGIREVYTQSTAEGVVMRMEPVPGTRVPAKSRIAFVVASLKTPPKPAEPKPAPVAPTVQDSQAAVSALEQGQPVPAGQEIASSPSSVTGAAREPAEPAPAPVPSAPAKTARIRYQVPPLTKPMQLKIEMVDVTGTRELLNRSVNGGEYISLDAPYSKEVAITIYLGGTFVWQDRYR
jgi:serine/threonine-protein kinase